LRRLHNFSTLFVDERLRMITILASFENDQGH
jgi:hypothetical protein